MKMMERSLLALFLVLMMAMIALGATQISDTLIDSVDTNLSGTLNVATAISEGGALLADKYVNTSNHATNNASIYSAIGLRMLLSDFQSDNTSIWTAIGLRTLQTDLVANNASIWATLNTKGNTSSSGTAGYLPKFSSSNLLTDSGVQDDGQNLTIERNLTTSSTYLNFLKPIQATELRGALYVSNITDKGNLANTHTHAAGNITPGAFSPGSFSLQEGNFTLDNDDGNGIMGMEVDTAGFGYFIFAEENMVFGQPGVYFNYSSADNTLCLHNFGSGTTFWCVDRDDMNFQVTNKIDINAGQGMYQNTTSYIQHNGSCWVIREGSTYDYIGC